MTRGKVQQLLLDSADISQTENGAAGNDAPFGFDGAAGAAGHSHRKSAAVATQRINGLFHTLRCRGLQPCPERKHALARGRRHEHCGITDDLRLFGSGRPSHKNLWLRQQQCFEPIDISAQRCDFIAGIDLGTVCASAYAKHDHDCKQCKAEQGEDERQRRDLLFAEGRQRAMHGTHQRCAELCLGADRRAAQAQKTCEDEGGKESASPRTRTQPLVRRPD